MGEVLVSRTIGAKGEIVIPKEVRDKMNLEKGSPVLVLYRDGKIVIQKVALGE